MAILATDRDSRQRPGSGLTQVVRLLRLVKRTLQDVDCNILRSSLKHSQT